MTFGRKKLGDKSKPRGMLHFILGGSILVSVVGFGRLGLLDYSRLLKGDNQQIQKIVVKASETNTLPGTHNNILEHLWQKENVTEVVRVTTELERSQLIELAKFAHEACSSIGISIFAGYGTLLGGLRHHDIIPWDDDMDFAVVVDDWSQVMQLHNVFEKRGREMPHPVFGTIGKTAPNLTPHCWKKETCNITTDSPPTNRPFPYPFLGMFRTHFMKSKTVEWSYNYNCTKEEDFWCSRWPSLDIFMYIRDDGQLKNIVGWFPTVPIQSVYPLRDILVHGVLFKAPFDPSLWRYAEKDLEFGDCHAGPNHRGGGMTHFKANCTEIWDQVPFVRQRERTADNGTVEIAYQNNTVVSVLRLNEKGENICHATILEWLSGQVNNDCGVAFG